MSTQVICIIFIGICACLSLLQGFTCARRAMKGKDTVLAIFAVVFSVCGIALLVLINSIK